MKLLVEILNTWASIQKLHYVTGKQYVSIFISSLSLRVERAGHQRGHQRLRGGLVIERDPVQTRGPLQRRVVLVVRAGGVVLPLLALMASQLRPRWLRGDSQSRVGTHAGCVLPQAVAVEVSLGAGGLGTACLPVRVGRGSLTRQCRGGVRS